MTLDARIGSEIAAYRIERFVGRGGMGVVYQANDLRLGRRVALKLLSAELSDDDHFRDRFVRESRLAASLDHHNIVPIYAAGEVDGQLYVAMRYVEGTDLRALVAERGPLEPPHAVDLVSQVASALDAAHSRGLVHRDVKTANVLLSSEADHAYLADFGLAKQMTSGSAMTRSGILIGTVDYLAPEVIEGVGADARADQYALACVLFECLTGTPPFRRPTEASTMWAHMRDDPPPLSVGGADLGPPLRRALSKAPSDRYPTCGEFLDDVRSRLPGEALERGWLPSTRLAVLAVAILLASVAVAVGVTAHLAGSTARSVRPAPPPNSLVAVDARTGLPRGQPIPLGRSPSDVVVSGKWVWVSSVAAGTLTLIDGGTGQVKRNIRLGATPTNIAAGAAGSVWVAEGLARQVVQVYPQADRISVTVSLPGCCPGPTAITVRADVVWVGDATGVWRIASGTGTPQRAESGWPAAAAATTDPDGNPWFTDGWGHVVSITEDAGFRERHPQFGQPSGIAWGADHAWIALPYTDAVVSYDSTGVSGSLIKVAGEPTAVAFGNGALWVGATQAGTITRITPFTHHRRTTEIGGRITSIAVGHNVVWAAIEPASALESGAGAVAYSTDARQLATTRLDDPGAATIVADSVNIGMPDWSPTGTGITYTNTTTGRITTNPSCKVQNCSSIHTMRADGTHRRQLTHPKRLAGDVAPRWSPDGTRIAAWRDYQHGHPPVAQLLMMDADGRHQRILRSQSYASGVTPQLDWSPDGSKLVLQTLLDGHQALEIVDTAGHRERILTVTEAYAPRWSPDGTRIAYFSSIDGPGIYVTGVDGQITHKLIATSAGSGTLTWAPDGGQLAFAYASDATSLNALNGDTSTWGAVYVVDADGSGVGQLTAGPAGFPAWDPDL